MVLIEEVFPNGLALYPDPMEDDCNLYLGMFALWRKDLVDLRVSAEGAPSTATETSTATPIFGLDISTNVVPSEGSEEAFKPLG